MATQIVTTDTFRTAVVESDKPVLVDFWAEWCGPCKKIAPVLEELSEELGDSVSIVKVNVDEERALATMFQIMSIPSLYVFKDGQKVDEIVGVQPKASIRAKLEAQL
ncbi:thioredoxin [Corynebacterium sputi]|uniref:thioredoxin n=1 Tax=Corynebacterium sputi TaxID=489915 RepID=UPI000408434D|nr:thioredoxin [Corynebacterium sputi]